jgi:CHAD domain-containing protein
MPAAVRALAREAAEAAGSKRPALVKAAREAITSARVQGAMLVMARVIEEQTAGDGAKARAAEKALDGLVREALAKRERQVKKAFGKAARKQTPDALHAARIAVKKLRYVTELAEEGADGGAAEAWKRQVKLLKKIQELLGEHHDAHVILQVLEGQMRAQKNAPPASMAAWKRWRAAVEKQQARRAGLFFAASYAWINRKADADLR